ncbi:MAG: RNA polymerase sigma factor [Bacteroidota bacterium]
MKNDDDHIIQKLKSGDQSAFYALIKSYENRVMQTCYKFFLNKEDAEDLSQEVFLEIFQSIHSFRGNSKFSTWIYRITITKCLDEIKRRNRKKRIDSFKQMLHIDDVTNWITGGVMPDKNIHQHDNMKQILMALNTLPDSQRIAFTLSKIEGYTNKEIAEIMNTTTNAVELLVSRAKKKTGDELKAILKNNS